MTLILSLNGPGLGVMTVSDVLVASPDSKNRGAIQPPSRNAAISHSNAGHQIAGLRRKIVVSGKTVILWAGSLVTARVIIQSLLESSNEGKIEVDFPNLLESVKLTTEELSEVSIIYHYFDDTMIRRYSHNCDLYESGGFNARVAGSGGWDFIQNTDVRISANPSRREAILAMMMRVGYHIIKDASTVSNYDFMYGGWIESFIDENGILATLPYAVKFWYVDEHGVSPDPPLFFSWYDDGKLFVCRADFLRGSATINVQLVNGLMDSKSQDFDIPSKIKWEPRTIFHVILRKGFPMRVMMEAEIGGRLSVHVDPDNGSTKLEISKDLMEDIFTGGAPADGEYEITRILD